MKVLGSAVLTMEVFVMGFAMLLAKDIHEPATIVYGFGFMVVTIATVGLLKKRIGWIIGSILQFALMAYSVVVPAMAIACNDCSEGNCVGDAVAAAVTAASTMAVKAAAR